MQHREGDGAMARVNKCLINASTSMQNKNHVKKIVATTKALSNREVEAKLLAFLVPPFRTQPNNSHVFRTNMKSEAGSPPCNMLGLHGGSL
jgi:hypothetical protein